MHHDVVFWGAIICVVGSIVVLGFLAFKVKGLISQDAENRKQS